MHEYVPDWPYIVDKFVTAMVGLLVVATPYILSWLNLKNKLLSIEVEAKSAKQEAAAAKAHGEENAKVLKIVDKKTDVAVSEAKQAKQTAVQTSEKLDDNTDVTKDVQKQLQILIDAKAEGK